ncbi:MAG: hypothetical protein R3B95_06190 [Nitrospirales bacterium]|nr:hypothetical protein [Nitrospirales bacterium]
MARTPLAAFFNRPIYAKWTESATRAQAVTHTVQHAGVVRNLNQISRG